MNKKPTISIIAAISKGLALGKDNKLLWDIPEDMCHFRKISSGHPVIMGEKTHYSIGRPLPKRLNIVLSKNPDLKIPGCQIAHSIKEAIDIAAEEDSEEIFFIGGGSVYAQALPVADKLYLTIVDGQYEADTFFPEYGNQFKIIRARKSSDKNYRYDFLELERK